VALPSLLAGVGLAASLPPWGAWILAFPAAGLLWWRLGGLRPRTRLWAGWLAGLGCYVPGLLWARSFTLVGAVVLIALEALFPALGALVVPAGPVGARLLAFPAAMTLAEAVRMRWPFGGLPIGGVFLGQAGGPVLDVARLGGPLALTAAVYLGGAGLGALAVTARRVGTGAPAGHGRALLTGGLAVAVTVAAVVAGAVAPDGGPPTGTLSAAAVQGGGVRGLRKSQVDPAVVLAAAEAATVRMEALDGGRSPRLVLWPEDVVSLGEPLGRSPEEAELSALAAHLHTTLVVGVTETVSATAFRNEAVAFGPDGALVDRYEKVHRVPFGEYVPDRAFFAHLASLSAVPLDAVPGHGDGVLHTPAGRLGTMISYEVFYADRGRAPVRAGAELLIVPTNTSSYATAQVPTQEVAADEVQAVEQGRDLLQAAPTGYSTVVTNRGALLRRSVLGARQVLFARLSLRSGWTPYVRFGDGPPLGAAGLALVLGWWTATRRRRPASRYS
jgi:apolipoprotein N-acyltransferase